MTRQEIDVNHSETSQFTSKRTINSKETGVRSKKEITGLGMDQYRWAVEYRWAVATFGPSYWLLSPDSSLLLLAL